MKVNFDGQKDSKVKMIFYSPTINIIVIVSLDSNVR